MPSPEVDPYDAVLLVSFGGPEAPEDVVPFLENVTRGRGIPRERLEEVGEHYFAFGGKSPINDQNRAFKAALEAELAAHGIDLPVYWGNRNWTPYLTDVIAQMASDGVRRAACLVTSAYSSWSSCRQYRENLFDAVDALPAGATAPVLDKLRVYFNHPGFVEPVVDDVVAAVMDLSGDQDPRLVFVTHSIPTSMNDASGPPPGVGEGGRYVAQHEDVAEIITVAASDRLGRDLEHDLVFCSRSGPPHIPWLEPDVNDHLETLAAGGTQAVVIVPIGFVSDHMEVVYDLDTEALETSERLGLAARRVPTTGVDPRFVAAARELIVERAAAERGEDVARPALGSLGAHWDRCPVDCCLQRPGQEPRPTLSGETR